MTIAVGIDPSLTSAAACAGPASNPIRSTFHARPPKASVAGRIDRFSRHAASIADWLADIGPDVIVVEGYAFGAKGKREHLAEFGGLLRERLVRLTPNVYELAPSSLKKFVTGKGNADKAAIASTLTRQHRVTFENSDEADAFACWRVALIIGGAAKATNDRQREVISKVLEGHGKALEVA